MNEQVLLWIKEASFDHPMEAQGKIKLSFDEWLAQGRALLQAIDTLITLLRLESLEQPSDTGIRAAYALGWIGDRRPALLETLIHALGSRDTRLRMEAVAALGYQGNASHLPLLEQLLSDPQQDINIRANACIALGRIGAESSRAVLKRMQHDKEHFLSLSTQEGLRLLELNSTK